MICGFSVCYYEDGLIENAKLEEGYVAGKSYDDCFQKIREWYFGKDTDEYASITISSIDEGWVDEEKERPYAYNYFACFQLSNCRDLVSRSQKRHLHYSGSCPDAGDGFATISKDLFVMCLANYFTFHTNCSIKRKEL